MLTGMYNSLRFCLESGGDVDALVGDACGETAPIGGLKRTPGREFGGEEEKRRKISEVLNEGNIYTVERLLATDCGRLVQLSQNKWNRKDSRALKLQVAHKLFTPGVCLTHAYDHTQFYVHKLTTGCTVLDTLLMGGVRTEEITEFCGPTSSGKTQVCLSIVAGLAMNYESRAIYIDTCNGLSVPRLKEICESRGMVSHQCLENVECIKVFDVSHLGRILSRILTNTEGQIPLRLLVIDSISAVFAPVIGGTKNTLGYSTMKKTARTISQIATELGVAVVLTNSTVQDATHPFLTVKPSLGQSWSFVPNERVLFQVTENPSALNALLVKSSRSKCSAPSDKNEFEITNEGAVPITTS
mmetsp:Transcript_18068/g.29298  ORF Transcript_18068/g.29298 Transcript_18068/m.29298 type:complete len:357 (+) Transcript_18068:98-1168(+)